MLNKFLSLVNHPLKYKLFLLTKLPSAFFSGVRVTYADEEKCIVKIPFKWFSQNPFKSTYFACLSMAAEMSTGVLAMANTYQSNPPVSMLVLKVVGNYTKKATGFTYFTCEDGLALKQLIEGCIASKEAKPFTATSIGRNKEGDLIAEFEVTWSFKAKST